MSIIFVFALSAVAIPLVYLEFPLLGAVSLHRPFPSLFPPFIAVSGTAVEAIAQELSANREECWSRLGLTSQRMWRSKFMTPQQTVAFLSCLFVPKEQKIGPLTN
jgi:hypothetical protein